MSRGADESMGKPMYGREK